MAGSGSRRVGERREINVCARMPGAKPDTMCGDRGLIISRDRTLSLHGCCVRTREDVERRIVGTVIILLSEGDLGRRQEGRTGCGIGSVCYAHGKER